VDLNLAAQTPWLAHQLQFVAGLGPRKAMALLKAVQRQEQVAARKAVWKELNVIGKKVFWSVTETSRVCQVLPGETGVLPPLMLEQILLLHCKPLSSCAEGKSYHHFMPLLSLPARNSVKTQSLPACLEHTSALCACWHAGMQQVHSESGALQLG